VDDLKHLVLRDRGTNCINVCLDVRKLISKLIVTILIISCGGFIPLITLNLTQIC